MATGDAGVCNLALARVGITKYIDDLDEETKEAETCKVFYSTLRDSCLAAFPWSFATLRQTLAVKADEPARDGWAKIYALPDDYLAVRKVCEPGVTRMITAQQRVPYVIEKSSTDDSSVLLCDIDTPLVFYTAKFLNPQKFPPLFADAFAWLLASEIAMPLNVKLERAEVARKVYKEKIKEAWAASLNQEQEDPSPEAEAIRERA